MTAVLDGSIALGLRGYGSLAALRRKHASDVFDIRLFGMPATCLASPRGARLFYDESRFARAGVMPGMVKKTLFGEGGVQGMDDAAHRRRKALLMSLTTPGSVAALSDNAASLWAAAAEEWQQHEQVVLFDAASEVLTRAVCGWAGAPLPAVGAGRVAENLVAMIDGFASLGLRQWRGRRGRTRTQWWTETVIDNIREGSYDAPEGSAARVIAEHSDLDDQPLPTHVAAVELLNVIRPTVAICWYVAFAAHALHHHPQQAEALRDGDGAALERFAQEVRRYYPFTPFLAARARQDFTWEGHEFPRGRMALLDVYGIDHDPQLWAEPERFDPDRFLERPVGAYDLIPQGGGDPHTGHRCAGESVTMALLKGAVRFLLNLEYDVPRQDLRIPLHRMPTRPTSGFVMTRVRTPEAAHEPRHQSGAHAAKPYQR